MLCRNTSDLAIGKAIPVFKVSENYETVYIDKYIVHVLNNGEIILSYFAIYKEEKGVYSAHGLTAELKYIIEEEKESCLIEYDSSVLVATNDGYRYLSDIGFVPSDSTTYPKYPPSFVAKLINKYTIYGYKAVEGTISSTVIRNRINKGKPVVLYCVSENNYKHYITVYGYCDYGEVLEYYDSADDNKDQPNTMDVSLKKMYS